MKNQRQFYSDTVVMPTENHAFFVESARLGGELVNDMETPILKAREICTWGIRFLKSEHPTNKWYEFIPGMGRENHPEFVSNNDGSYTAIAPINHPVREM